MFHLRGYVDTVVCTDLNSKPGFKACTYQTVTGQSKHHSKSLSKFIVDTE